MAQNQSIFDRLRAMQTEGLPLHTLIVEACEVGNAALAALSDIVAYHDTPEPLDAPLVPLIDAACSVLTSAYASNGDTPENGARAA